MNPADIHPDTRIWKEAKSWILERTVALYAQMPGGNPVQRGSGVLLQIADAGFLASASHVMDIAKEAEIWIAPMDPGAKGFVKIAPVQVKLTVDQVRHDLAIVRLPSAAIEALTGRKRFVQLEEMDLGTSMREGRYYVAGYPIALTKTDHDTMKISIGLYARATHLTTSEASYAGVSIALAYGKDAIGVNEAGAPTRNPPLGGISGCGIWRLWAGANLDPLAEWNPSWIRFVGLEHGTVGEAIIGTLCCQLAGFIAREHPDLKPALGFV